MISGKTERRIRMKNEKTSELLHKVPLFQDLTKQELERVEEITISRFISKKANVFWKAARKKLSTSLKKD